LATLCISGGLVRIAEFTEGDEEIFKRLARVHAAKYLVRRHADAEQRIAGQFERVRNVQWLFPALTSFVTLTRARELFLNSQCRR
jgi:hypothetical protein